MIIHSLLTAHKCPAAIANPTANGADPLISFRFGSDTALTTKINIDVIKASISTDCPVVRDGEPDDTPKPTPETVCGSAIYV